MGHEGPAQQQQEQLAGLSENYYLDGIADGTTELNVCTG